jgi:hypothetical protein
MNFCNLCNSLFIVVMLDPSLEDSRLLPHLITLNIGSLKEIILEHLHDIP